jgi:uroporphyrin-III C-methyltransferase
MKIGVVQLIGAGPGDPELITVKGLRRLEQADVVVHDRLVSRQLLDLAPPTARRIDVGKTPGMHRWSQRRINTLLVAEARRGRRVVRLKGGDPFVFGRGGEECEALVEARIPFEVVPGVSSAVAAAAYAGIPVTHRSHTSAFAVVTGHSSNEFDDLDWEALSRVGTLVVLMGLGSLRRIVQMLRANGRAADTPVAIVSRATVPEQRSVRGTLADIVIKARYLTTPATIVVGNVVALGDRLSWFAPERIRQDQRRRTSARSGATRQADDVA